MRRANHRVLALLLSAAIGWSLAPASRAADAAQLDADLAALADQYAAWLAELADWCRERRLDELAERTTAWHARVPPLAIDVARIDGDALALPAAEGSAEYQEWRNRFVDVRRKQAGLLFDKARQAAEAREPALAYQLVLATLREDPDHAAARSMLGYEQLDGRWLTQFDRDKHTAGLAWHPKFGWLKADQVARYESGERYLRGRWVTAAEDARAHQADPSRGWQVMTEHFSVRTNHSLEEGARVAALLEQLRAAWFALFVGYVAGDDLTGWFDGNPLVPRPLPPMEVYLYRDRAQYVAALRKSQPQIEITAGFYDPAARRAYFYHGIEDRYVFHEATHQLFSESRSTPRSVGRETNFWVTEGVACYMESLQVGPTVLTLGGANGGRLPKARFAVLEDRYYVPLAVLCGRGSREFQQDPQIALEYCQAAGVVHFLMHGLEHRRRVLVGLLDAVYRNQDDVRTLSTLTDTAYPDLDAEYLAFLKAK